MARSQVTDERKRLQIWTAAANVSNKQSLSAQWDGPSVWVLGRVDQQVINLKASTLRNVTQDCKHPTACDDGNEPSGFTKTGKIVWLSD
jgi:hypothetical protein